MSPRLALYVRVSTTDQAVDIQLDQLRTYAGRRGVEALEFVDWGHSGRKDRRPGLDGLLEAVRRRQVDAVAITKLDRLFRSTRHLTALAAELQALDVDLVVLDQAIDTSTPAGRLLFNMLGAIAEFEAGLIRERTRQGVDAARRRGRRPGRPPSLDQRQRDRARRLRTSGKSVREIAEMLDVSRSVVGRALKT